MKPKDEEFRRKLLGTFAAEAKDHLQTLASRLIDLEKVEKAERSAELVEAAFREAHSLKGAARAVDATEIESICQTMESTFAALKKGECGPSRPLLDSLHDALNVLEGLLASLGKESPAAEKGIVEQVIRRLEEGARTQAGVRPGRASAPESPSPPQPANEPEGPASAETVRITAGKLDQLLLKAEELLSAKLTANYRAADVRELLVKMGGRQKQWTKIQPDLRLLQHFVTKNGSGNGQSPRMAEIRNVLEFLEQERSFHATMDTTLAGLAKSADQDARVLARMVDGLLEESKKLRMLPFTSLLEGFPRFLRNLSREKNKEVDLIVHGGEIEIDRRILEEMKDPLIHLLRNCIDHGIESPDERSRKNKPRRGAITLTVTARENNRMEIVVADDGSGIDSAKLLAVAHKRGIAPGQAGKEVSAGELLSLIFESGVSTSPIITDISGRGLGLTIARERVEKLGGTIAVETESGQGTAFRILLPLSVATFRGLLVRVGDRQFVLPLADVERIVRVSRREIQTVENRETIQLNGHSVGIAHLGDLLELPHSQGAADSAEMASIAVANSGGKRIGLLVDEVIAEQEVLVKGLGPQLLRVRNISSAAVLATGKVTPVLNVSDLMKSAVRAGGKMTPPAPAQPRPAQKRKTILVVEDSITARTLLKNILEAADYAVQTAIDGVDAFTILKTASFDLVVSDVDMPRLNGLDLTAKIRADKKFGELPVILVTALESREDRERGIDVGANAYIVKSSFEQGNLLEVVRQLI